MTLRIALIDNQTGDCEIGGVRCKVVPVEPTDYYYEWDTGFGLRRSFSAAQYNGMPPNRSMPLLSAAAIDLSGLPVVPPRSPDVASDLNYWLDEIGVKE